MDDISNRKFYNMVDFDNNQMDWEDEKEAKSNMDREDDIEAPLLHDDASL